MVQISKKRLFRINKSLAKKNRFLKKSMYIPIWPTIIRWFSINPSRKKIKNKVFRFNSLKYTHKAFKIRPWQATNCTFGKIYYLAKPKIPGKIPWDLQRPARFFSISSELQSNLISYLNLYNSLPHYYETTWKRILLLFPGYFIICLEYSRCWFLVPVLTLKI